MTASLLEHVAPKALAVALALWGLSALASEDLPKGWFPNANPPGTYDATVETQSACEGDHTVVLRSRDSSPIAFGTLAQRFFADKYRGKRVRFSAVLRSEKVVGWAGLWMRIEANGVPLAFDDMRGRTVHGTTGCARYEVVLDIPQNATRVVLGMLLTGPGALWMSGMHFEVVDGRVATTDLMQPGQPVELRETAPSGTGRIGPVWFDRDSVGEWLHRRPNGTWTSNPKDESLVVQEHGQVVVIEANRDPVTGVVPFKGELKVWREGNVTRIGGFWKNNPVDVRLSKDRVSFRWGGYSRELVHEGVGPPGCEHFHAKDSTGAIVDSLDLCKDALSDNPPPVQLVLAVLGNGFQRPTAGSTETPWPIPVARVREDATPRPSGREPPEPAFRPQADPPPIQYDPPAAAAKQGPLDGR